MKKAQLQPDREGPVITPMKTKLCSGTLLTLLLISACSSAPGRRNYSGLNGTWIAPAPWPGYAMAMRFMPGGAYTEFLYADPGETFTTTPRSLVWTGTGDYRVEFDVLVIRITGTSDNMPAHNRSYHFVQFGDSEITLLDTASGKRSTLRRNR